MNSCMKLSINNVSSDRANNNKFIATAAKYVVTSKTYRVTIKKSYVVALV